MHFNFTVEKNNPSSGKIVLHITDSQNQKLCVATPLRINPEDWDTEKQRPENIYLKVHKLLNQKLDRLRIGISEYLQEVEDKKAVLSAKTIHRRINKARAEDNYPKGSLLYAMHRYIHSRTHLITHATYKRYQVFLRLLERFEGYRGKRYSIEHINAEFVKDFLSFGKAEQYNQSTVTRTLHFVRTILNYLEKRGVRTFIYELEIPKSKPKQNGFATLNDAELEQIGQTEVQQNLHDAKDWLLISCYTGQRISDFMHFSTTQLLTVGQKLCIGFVQQKTQKYVLLPLHPVVVAILNKRNGQFPKRLSATAYNRQIKEVARLAGIRQKVTTGKRRGFRAKEETVPKWQAVTSHTGRRSFASNFYGRIPTALLMEATGHSTEQMFRRYIGHADTARVSALAKYFEQSYNNDISTNKNVPNPPLKDTATGSCSNAGFVNPTNFYLTLSP